MAITDIENRMALHLTQMTLLIYSDKIFMNERVVSIGHQDHAI